MGFVTMKVDRAAINEVVRELDAVGDLEIRAPAALEAGAKVLLAAVQGATPVRSGRLKKSIGIRRRGRAVEVGAIGSGVSHLVEYGHGGPKPAPAHPFVEPAADSVADAVTDAIISELLKGLD